MSTSTGWGGKNAGFRTLGSGRPWNEKTPDCVDASSPPRRRLQLTEMGVLAWSVTGSVNCRWGWAVRRLFEAICGASACLVKHQGAGRSEEQIGCARREGSGRAESQDSGEREELGAWEPLTMAKRRDGWMLCYGCGPTDGGSRKNRRRQRRGPRLGEEGASVGKGRRDREEDWMSHYRDASWRRASD